MSTQCSHRGNYDKYLKRCLCIENWSAVGDFAPIEYPITDCDLNIPAIKALNIVSVFFCGAVFLYLTRMIYMRRRIQIQNAKLISWVSDQSEIFPRLYVISCISGFPSHTLKAIDPIRFRCGSSYWFTFLVALNCFCYFLYFRIF